MNNNSLSRAKEIAAPQIVELENMLSFLVGHKVKVFAFSENDNAFLGELVDGCCNIWGVDKEQLKQKNRSHKVVAMRSIISFAIKSNYPKVPLVTIAALFNQDHTDILNNIQRVKNLSDVEDPLLMSYYEPVKHLCNVG